MTAIARVDKKLDEILEKLAEVTEEMEKLKAAKSVENHYHSHYHYPPAPPTTTNWPRPWWPWGGTYTVGSSGTTFSGGWQNTSGGGGQIPPST